MNLPRVVALCESFDGSRFSRTKWQLVVEEEYDALYRIGATGFDHSSFDMLSNQRFVKCPKTGDTSLTTSAAP